MESFKDWLVLQEMAFGDVIRKACVPMDQDDIDYLNNFPSHQWLTALVRRYNEELNSALNKDGKIRRGYLDRWQIRKVVNKLKNLGYDIRNTEPGSGHLAGMKLMQSFNARAILYGANQKLGWIKWSAKQLGLEAPKLQRLGAGRGITRDKLDPNKGYGAVYSFPKGFRLIPQPPQSTPEMSLWCPNWSKRESFGHVGGAESYLNSTMQRQIMEDAKTGVERALELLKERQHWNFTFLSKHISELEDIAIKDLMANTRRPEFTDQKWRIKRVMLMMSEAAKRDWGGGSNADEKRRRKLGLPDEFVVRRRAGAPGKHDTFTLGPSSVSASTTPPPAPTPIYNIDPNTGRRRRGRPRLIKPTPSYKTSLKWDFRNPESLT